MVGWMVEKVNKIVVTMIIMLLFCGGLGCTGTEGTESDNTNSIEAELYYTNSIGMEFVKIPSGEFMMGSPEDEENRWNNEGPVHKVTIEEPFYMGKFEVTQEQWREVMGTNPSNFKGEDLPVENVSWNDVQEFIKKLNEMEGTDKYRLPSEAEWEYACRAGTTTRYYFGDDESKLKDYAWYNDNSKGFWGLKSGATHHVGQKKPNPWGLYDMEGNVFEWCQDKWHDDYDGAPIDGSSWESGLCSGRVSRGGSWGGYAKSCRSANRYGSATFVRSDGLGFRVLIKIDDVPEPVNTPHVVEEDVPEEKSKTNTTQTSSSQNLDADTNSIGMEFVKIPAGEFMMGSPEDEENRWNNEGPVHKVTIEESYYLGKYEVTQEQWREVMGTDPSIFKGDDLPVEEVSWNDVQEFIKKLNEMEGTNKYRLPSEAEWEYACRAGTTTRYYFGDDGSELDDYAWYWDNSDKKIHSVGQKKPNPWGLYDMHGSVWEWCQDNGYSDYYGAPTDGSSWEIESKSYRFMRGGSWGSYANSCRSASRGSSAPDSMSRNLGFRVVREI